MPTYEYECKSCGHTFEVFQAMSDDPLKNCPKCGKEVRRLIFGGTGVIFKGSGFYVTDKSKGSSGGAAAKTSKPADTAPAGGSGSGPEKSQAASSSKSEGSGGESAPKKTGAGEKTGPAAKTA